MRRNTEIIKNNYLLVISNIKKLNWISFSIVFLLIAGLLNNYYVIPSKVVFPYHKSVAILSGGWLPQSPNEKYRWIAGDATIKMNEPRGSSKLIINGYVPVAYKKVTNIEVLMDKTIIYKQKINEGDVINIQCPVQSDSSKDVNIEMKFNAIHIPDNKAPDQRRMSAFIKKIEFTQ